MRHAPFLKTALLSFFAGARSAAILAGAHRVRDAVLRNPPHRRSDQAGRQMVTGAPLLYSLY